MPIFQDQETVRAIMLQLVEGVTYLHEQRGIAHRDLKPENLYWDATADEGKGRLLIGDFGLASAGRYASDFGNGTSFYASPDAVGYFRNIAAKEALTRSTQSRKGYRPRKEEDDPRQYRYDAFASDVWSIGIILINLACERNPWQYASANDDAFTAYVAHPHSFLKSILPDLTEECHTLLKGILALQPEKRLSLADIKIALSKMPGFTYSACEQSGTVPGGNDCGPAARNSWIEMESSKDSCRSVSTIESAQGSDASDQGPVCWIIAAPSPSAAFYSKLSPVDTVAPEYRFPPLPAALPSSSQTSSNLSPISPMSVPCSLSLSASTEGSEDAATPAAEIEDPMLAVSVLADAAAARIEPIKRPTVLFRVVAKGDYAGQSAPPARSTAPMLALPLPPNRSPRPPLSPLITIGDASLPSPVGLVANVPAPRTPQTPNFSFNPSPSIMTSPLRHAQQAFLEKHYMHYGPRRGSLPLAGVAGERRVVLTRLGCRQLGRYLGHCLIGAVADLSYIEGARGIHCTGHSIFT